MSVVVEASAATTATDRVCAWCSGPIPAGARRDAVCCSKRCRQARHRFTTAVGSGSTTPLVAHGHPRRIAYADPPYPGKSRRYYGEHPDFAGEVDHRALIEWLSAEHDAWALSTSAEALPMVLGLCPPDVRVAAWHRGFRPNVLAAGPLNAWEPVIYAGQVFRRAGLEDASRPTSIATRRGALEDVSRCAAADLSRPPGERVAVSSSTPVAEDLHDVSPAAARRVDSLVYRATARTTDPARVIGAKPAEFCRWVFELLAASVEDEFVDVFPGSGGVARAWASYAGKPAVLGDRSW